MGTNSGMKVLLQNKRTRLFYQGRESWTPDPIEAFDFQLSAELPDFEEKLNLRETALVVHFTANSPALALERC